MYCMLCTRYIQYPGTRTRVALYSTTLVTSATVLLYTGTSTTVQYRCSRTDSPFYNQYLKSERRNNVYNGSTSSTRASIEDSPTEHHTGGTLETSSGRFSTPPPPFHAASLRSGRRQSNAHLVNTLCQPSLKMPLRPWLILTACLQG